MRGSGLVVRGVTQFAYYLLSAFCHRHQRAGWMERREPAEDRRTDVDVYLEVGNRLRNPSFSEQLATCVHTKIEERWQRMNASEEEAS